MISLHTSREMRLARTSSLALFGQWLVNVGLLDDPKKLPEKVGQVSYQADPGRWVFFFRPDLTKGYRIKVNGKFLPGYEDFVMSLPMEIEIGIPVALRFEEAP